MSQNKEHIELIDLYLKGELKGTELENFQREISSNSSLQAELKLQEAIYQAAEVEGEEKLRLELNQMHDNFIKNGGLKNNTIRKKALLISGAIIMAIGTVFIFVDFEKEDGSIKAPIEKEKGPNKEIKDSIVQTKDSTFSNQDTAKHANTSIPDSTTRNTDTRQEVEKDKVIKEISIAINPVEKTLTNTYSYSKGILKLYGYDNWDINNIAIYQSNGVFVLNYGNRFFEIEETNRNSSFKEYPPRDAELLRFATGRGPTIQINKQKKVVSKSFEKGKITIIENPSFKQDQVLKEGFELKMTRETYDRLGANFKIYIQDKELYIDNGSIFNLVLENNSYKITPRLDDKLIFFDGSATKVVCKSLTFEDREKYMQNH